VSWSAEQAEEHLLGLEMFGMRFGLDRMHRLMTALGRPDEQFRQVHVVGTNGKSSTVRMIAAILERHGVRSGAYLSPHLVRFAERIRIGDADVEPDAFGAAVERAVRAAAKVDRTLEGGDRVTQFELMTAAALDELARRGVEVGVIEAGLGGRWDATNVVHRSEVQVLTNVGLEHTRWLGPTIADVASEKLAVVRDGATLVLGAGLHPDAEAKALAVVERHGATLVRAAADPDVRAPGLRGFQRRNFALARAAAEALHGPLDPAKVDEAAAHIVVPGRLQIVDRDPVTLLDGAHNPAGLEALVESLPDVIGDAPLVAVVSILEDKDAAAMLRALLPRCAAVVFTRSVNPRALPPATLLSLAGQLDGPPAEVVAAPRAALDRARELATALGGAALVTGSIYLVADLVAEPGARRASRL
jgi:dihydrofolate synthase/folylpolyglutamate synthase